MGRAYLDFETRLPFLRLISMECEDFRVKEWILFWNVLEGTCLDACSTTSYGVS